MVAGQVLFSSDEMKAKKGILTKAEWEARYQAPLNGPAPLGVPEYDPLLEAGQYNSKPMFFTATNMYISDMAPMCQSFRAWLAPS